MAIDLFVAGCAGIAVDEPVPPAPPATTPPSPRPNPGVGLEPTPPGPPGLIPSPAPALPPSGGPPAPAEPASFGCTLIIGTSQTAEWYETFETLVDDARWELVHQHSGFVERYADPHDAVWSLDLHSPCAAGAMTPDRIIFLALSGGAPNLPDLAFYSLDMWMPLLRADVKNIREKYPSVKRIELMTYVRAPMNKPCPGAPDYRSMIGPDQETAMAMIAAENPGLVTVAPPFAAASCSDFANIPHSTATARKAWGRMIAEHYGR